MTDSSRFTLSSACAFRIYASVEASACWIGPVGAVVCSQSYQILWENCKCAGNHMRGIHLSHVLLLLLLRVRLSALLLTLIACARTSSHNQRLHSAPGSIWRSLKAYWGWENGIGFCVMFFVCIALIFRCDTNQYTSYNPYLTRKTVQGHDGHENEMRYPLALT